MHYDPGMQARADYRAYTQRFELSPVEVSVAAQVRFMTVWRVAQGLPIGETYAQAVRAALWRLTGVPYTGKIVSLPDPFQS